MEPRVRRWSDLVAGELTEDAVRRFFTPPEQYRISPATYSPATTFAGSSRAGYWIVLAGACTLKMGHTVTLAAGDVLESEDGPFEFAVAGKKDVSVIRVWRLPAE